MSSVTESLSSKVLLGNIDACLNSRLADPLSAETLAFVEHLSRRLLNENANEYPDLIALGYWFRRANVEKFSSDFLSRFDSRLIRAKGNVLNIAPANVDGMFLYSGLLALIMGNRTFIRLSKRALSRQGRLLALLEECVALQEFAEVARRFVVFTCDYEHPNLQLVSENADLRIIWGGNDSVVAVRQLPLAPRGKDLSFYSRLSMAVIDATEVLRINKTHEEAFSKLVSDFFRDVFSFSQQACSSPKLIYWLGKGAELETAQDLLWSALYKKVQLAPEGITPASIIDRLSGIQLMCIEAECRIVDDNEFYTRISLPIDKLSALSHNNGNGIVAEINVDDVRQVSIEYDDRVQTLAYFGVDKLTLLEALDVDLVDRVVALGSSLTFDPVWDGYDLLYEFSRIVNV